MKQKHALNFWANSDQSLEIICQAIGRDSVSMMVETYSNIDDELLWKACEKNDVTPLIAHALIDALGEEKVPEHWRQAHTNMHERISAYLQELDRIAELLAQANIPLIALKTVVLPEPSIIALLVARWEI